METQNISGVDVIPKGFSVKNYSEDNEKAVQQNNNEKSVQTEESKGNNIDVKA